MLVGPDPFHVVAEQDGIPSYLKQQCLLEGGLLAALGGITSLDTCLATRDEGSLLANDFTSLCCNCWMG